MRTLSSIMLLGLSAVGCGGQDPFSEGNGETIDEITEELDSRPWCVDHPCPDLVPVKFSECPRSGSRLVVRIKNQWTLAAGPSTTRVYFDYYGGAATYATPGLSPGQTYQFTAYLPQGCLIEPGCVWRVKADYYDQVDETSGNNNSIAGACIY